jgi:chromosome partitioning protein
VVTKYRASSTVHHNTIRRLKDGKGELPTVLSTYIPERNDIAASAEFTDRGTLRQKYGYRGEYDAFRAMTKEFIKLVEEKV